MRSGRRLNAVIGMTHLMLHNEPRSDQKEDLGVLLFSANNLLSIVNNILDYNKIEEGKIGFENIPMDLAAIARNIVAGLKNAADERGIILRADVDPRLDRKVMGDPTRTSQVINNLVHNAVKFTKVGSVRLSITVDSVEPDRITVTIKSGRHRYRDPGRKTGHYFRPVYPGRLFHFPQLRRHRPRPGDHQENPGVAGCRP